VVTFWTYEEVQAMATSYLRNYLPTCLPRHISLYSSTALCRILAVFQFLDLFTQSVGLLGQGSARRKTPLVQDSIKTKSTHTDIHASSEIRTHNPSIRTCENGSYLKTPRPL
jgi:hypothetical protein